MRAVRGAESIVDIDFSERSKLLGKLGIVLFLFLVEEDVLQKNHVTGLHLGDALLRVGTDDVLGQHNLLVQLLAQTLGHGSQGVLHVELALGTAQMRAEDDGRIVIQQVLDGGQSRHNTGFIGNLRSVQRDVEVAANQYALAGYVDILNGLLVHNTHSLSVYCAQCFV